ncbi:MAG: cobyrinate a,c-diamide synthase [Megasphaera sp.]|uniref:cobyrinate a,c-diamide synthase n=1 Tax=Megasphaera sp. TaxID=2023260 RepID=UPI0025C3210E|nr:cobyrinate a,c-diamide synthase [Megasphaera sp.]MCI7599812.1 cobyrinate a,c-diamide synthase [Megasphaera sp.]
MSSSIQETPVPRLLLAAPCSGSGKTTVVCALLQALKDRGLSPAAFKSGPDYIDPMFHRRVLDTPSYNLDLFLFGRHERGAAVARDTLLYHGAAAGISILEGAMGYYDGVGTGSEASAYELAAATDTPVVLVVDGRGAGLSLAAVLKGMADFRADSHVVGFIVNRIKPMVYEHFKAAWEAASGLKALGCFPDMPDCTFSSRHLGLVTAGEIADLQVKMAALAAQAEKSLAIDELLACARQAAPLAESGGRSFHAGPGRAVIAVARDEAFCFYYEDSLQVLQQAGADLVFFSPLHDEALPSCDGLYLGGGYPELYAQALSRNTAMRASLRRALAARRPCFAECGGFMYLHETFRDSQDRQWPWVGAIPGETFMTSSLKRFGYVTLRAEKDNLLCCAGDTVTAHEFHYSNSACSGRDFTAYKAGSRRQWPCIVANDHFVGGYPHIHFLGKRAWATRFVAACIHGKEEKSYEN